MEAKKQVKKVSALEQYKSLVAGAAAGAVSRVATAPLDRLKTMLQVQQLTTMKQCIGQIRQGGGFYVGNGVNVLKVAPESAVKFFAFDKLKEVTGEKDDIPEVVKKLACGGLAGAMAQTSVYPLDVAKTRLQVWEASRRRPDLVCLLWKIASEEGFSALYKGLAPSLVGTIPYVGIDLATYDLLRAKFLVDPEHPDKLPESWKQVSCGMFAGSVAATSVYPLQVIRTRMQASSAPTSVWDVCQKTVAKEGVRGFYRGLLPSLTKVAPTASISYFVLERVKGLLSENDQS